MKYLKIEIENFLFFLNIPKQYLGKFAITLMKMFKLMKSIWPKIIMVSHYGFVYKDDIKIFILVLNFWKTFELG